MGFPLLLPSTIFLFFSHSPPSKIFLFFSHPAISLSISFFTTPMASSFILNITGRFLLQRLNILLFCSMLFVNLLFLLHNQLLTYPSSFQTQTRPVLHTLATSQKKILKRSLLSCSQKLIISRLNDVSKPCHKVRFHHQVVPRVLTNPLIGHRRHSAGSTLSVESHSQKFHFLPALPALFSLCSDLPCLALPCPALRCVALL